MQFARRAISWFLKQPFLYTVFHRVFSGKKQTELALAVEQTDAPRPIRVFDMGCGPGTNAGLFSDEEKFAYTGVDISPESVAHAREKYGDRFHCRDITADLSEFGRFDVVVINSVMHHLDDAGIGRTLANVSALLRGENGTLIVIDMVNPSNTGASWFRKKIVQLDRGAYCRDDARLTALLEGAFGVIGKREFFLTLFGIPIWEMRLWMCGGKERCAAAP